MNKKKIWTKGHVIKEFKVFPENRGGNFLDIGLQLGYIKYYEDIICLLYTSPSPRDCT